MVRQLISFILRNTEISLCIHIALRTKHVGTKDHEIYYSIDIEKQPSAVIILPDLDNPMRIIFVYFEWPSDAGSAKTNDVT